jgi:hypothetical protein
MEDLPSIDQFNHMIVGIRLMDGYYFVDATDKDIYPGKGIPYGLGGAKALVLHEEDPELVRIPDYPADSTKVMSTREIMVDNGTDAFVQETLEIDGYFSAYLRYLLRSVEEARRKEQVQDLMTGTGVKVALEDMRIENLSETDRPLRIIMAYRVKRVFQMMDDRIMGSLPDPWERYFVASEYTERRMSPFRISFPIVMSSAVYVRHPENLTPLNLAGFSGQEHSKYVRWKTGTETSSRGPAILFTFQLHKGRYPASEYASFHEAMEGALKKLETNLVLRPMDEQKVMLGGFGLPKKKQ